jgi:hypothetical protein
MENKLKLLNDIPTTKAEIKKYSASVIEEVKNGNIQPSQVAVFSKIISEISKEISEGIRENAVNEIQRSGKDTFHGHTIELMEGGTKYDYSVCNDSVINRLHSELAELEKKIKERETFLKSLPGTISVNDTETGEVMEVNKPLKKSTTTVKITLK